MKNKLTFALTSLLMFLFTSTITCQEKFDQYSSTYFKKSYNIDISKKDNGTYTFYIEATTLDKTSNKASLMVKSEDVKDFKAFFKAIQETYIKWKTTVEENKVTELDKKIESKKQNIQAAFIYGSKWNFDFSAQLTARVKIIDGNILLIVSSDKLESSSNQFMTNDGIYLVFSNPAEIEEFLSKLNEEKASKATEEKKKTDELFKE